MQAILDKLGDKKFLGIEEETILNLGNLTHSVIAPGGSVVYSTQVMTFLKENSLLIFLDAPLNIIQNQVSEFSGRGIVGLERGVEILFQERRPLYQQYADITIPILANGNNPTRIAEKILSLLDR